MDQPLKTQNSKLKTKIFLASDHAGFDLKNELVAFVRDELGYVVEDCGAHHLDAADDYPDFVHEAARRVAAEPRQCRGIVLGASGQGEAMVANRYPGVRAAVYYGNPAVKQTDAAGEALDLLTGTRIHNDANVLSLGARFLTPEDAKAAVQQWLQAEFSGDERHVRRIRKLERS
jgi:ribose 5-phosphate isomerase B